MFYIIEHLQSGQELCLEFTLLDVTHLFIQSEQNTCPHLKGLLERLGTFSKHTAQSNVFNVNPVFLGKKKFLILKDWVEV